MSNAITLKDIEDQENPPKWNAQDMGVTAEEAKASLTGFARMASTGGSGTFSNLYGLNITASGMGHHLINRIGA